MGAVQFADLTPDELAGPIDPAAAAAMVCAYEGPAIPMTPTQYGRLVEAAKGGAVIGRRAVLRAIVSKGADDAHD